MKRANLSISQMTEAFMSWIVDEGPAALVVAVLLSICLSYFDIQLGHVASGPAAFMSVSAHDSTPPGGSPSTYAMTNDPTPDDASRAVSVLTY